MPQTQSRTQSLEARPSKMATCLPVSLLRLLQPGFEGEWKVMSQTQRTFVLSFVLRQGHEAFRYEMNPCLTKADIDRQCGEFIYEWNNKGHSDDDNEAEMDCTDLTPATMEETTFSSCTPLLMPTSLSQGQFGFGSGPWTQSPTPCETQTFGSGSTMTYPVRPATMPTPPGSDPSPSTNSPGFMNLSNHQQSVSPPADLQVNNMFNMGINAASMTTSLHSSTIAVPGDRAIWDPTTNPNLGAPSPDNDDEPKPVDWYMMWNDN